LAEYCLTMNEAAKIIAKRLPKVVVPAVAAWAIWTRFCRKPLRPTLLDLAALAAACSAPLIATFCGSSRLGFGRVMTRIPAGFAFCHIALTFDGSPDPGSTPQILESLRAAGAKATFFVNLENAVLHAELVRRIAAEGHTIGVNCADSDPMVLWSERQVEHAIKIMRCELGNDIPEVRYFRPPHGWKSRAMQHAVDRLGMRMVTWSLNPNDISGNKAQLADRIARKASHGDIVLLHDCESTAQVLPTILKRLNGKGYDLIRL
jgi:peptidoglycan/xylan/chitin deacetylase (PgdA/CDA1 family)